MQHNVVIVAAAGNRGSGTTEVGAPATMPGVLTVAGVDRNEKASVDASAQGITIGVSAPSEQLLGAIPGGEYVEWEGTSGSTPIVAGVVALVMAAHPGITAANAINRVISRQRRMPAPKASTRSTATGWLTPPPPFATPCRIVSANPMGILAAWIHLNRRAEPTTTPTTPPTSHSRTAPTVAQSRSGKSARHSVSDPDPAPECRDPARPDPRVRSRRADHGRAGRPSFRETPREGLDLMVTTTL